MKCITPAQLKAEGAGINPLLFNAAHLKHASNRSSQRPSLRRSSHKHGSTRTSLTTFATAQALDAQPKSSSSTSSSSSAGSIVGSWPCKGGQLVQAFQSMKNDNYTLRIVLNAHHSAADTVPELHWGVFRSSPLKWQHPEAVIPKDSYVDQETGAMRTPMQMAIDGSYSLTLTIPANLAPITLGFLVHIPGAQSASQTYIKPLHGMHFAALIGLSPGLPSPLGPSMVHSAAAATKPKRSSKKQQPGDQATVNFAVRVMGAERVNLVLLKLPGPGKDTWGTIEIALDPVINRTGHTWHVAVPKLSGLDKMCYGWRLDGDVSWESGYRIQPDQLLLDPSAPLLQHLPTSLPPPPLPLPTTPEGYLISSLASLVSDASGAREGISQGPRRALERVRAMEIDVRTFAQGPKVANPGTYLGVAQRIDHIKAVGANMVVLTPVYATAPGSVTQGRAAVSYMAPDPALSTNPSDPGTAGTELRAMVDALHAAGIEVVPQFDLTFTAEGTDDVPSTQSMRGLDHAAYYRPNGVLNCGHPAVHDMVIRACRYWATEYGMDGFFFVNAENMVQDRDGTVLDAPPLAEALCFDPVLCDLKMIASPTSQDLLPRSGVRGFPHWGLWQQRNTAFARDMLAYMAEGTFFLNAVATRLTGSADIFEARWGDDLPGNMGVGRRPSFGFNSVSIMGKHSLAEVAREAAGLAAAAATAEGASGPAPAPTTVAKSLLALTVLSQGTPLINQTDVVDVEFARFVGVVMRLRRKLSTLLLPPQFDSPRDIQWHSVTGAEPEWEACSLEATASEGSNLSGCNYLAFSVRHPEGGAVYLGLNPHPHAVTAALPAAPDGHVWVRAVDTSLPAPQDAALDQFAAISEGSYIVPPKAVVVLVAAIVETA